MRKGERTKLRILEEAARQAAARGLAAVSLADVAEAVGLSKSGLFKHFESKEAMQREIVALVGDRFYAFVWAATEHLPPGRPRLEAAFQRWRSWGDQEWSVSGCPMNAFIAELDDQPGPLRDLLHEKLMAFRSAGIAAMRAVREPPLSESEAQAAYFQMRSYLLGYADAQRMMGDAGARDAAQQAFSALLTRLSAQAA